MAKPNKNSSIEKLLKIMATLRDVDGGCPWDLEQTFATLLPYTIEEAYEVAEAVESEDWESLKGELGDLLFQVVFHAQLAAELGLFDFDDVANAIAAKMIRRHPHVFGDASDIQTAADQTLFWEQHKKEEREAQARNSDAQVSELDGIGVNLPALMRANKLQNRAGRVGFDWPSPEAVMKDVLGELEELSNEIETRGSQDRLEDELGDVLFTVASLARHLGIDAETALRRGNAKFAARFRFIEERLAEQDRTVSDSSLEELDALWRKAKQA